MFNSPRTLATKLYFLATPPVTCSFSIAPSFVIRNNYKGSLTYFQKWFFFKLISLFTRFNFRTWDSTASISPTGISGEVKSQFSETSSPRHPSPVSTNGQIVCLTKRPLAFRLASSPSPLAASSLAELDAGARGERPGLPESLIISPIAFCHFPRRRFVLSCPLRWRRFSLS